MSASPGFPEKAPKATVSRILRLWLVSSIMLATYLLIGHAHRESPLYVTMPEGIPFWPVLTLPYLAVLVAAWILPLAIQDDRRFDTCLIASICAYLLVVPWWLLLPSDLHRPELPMEWWSGPYRWLVRVDAPTNVLPCAHALQPMIAVWFVAIDRPTWRGPLCALLVLGLPTIALTWQHRPVDIFLGLLIAGLAITVAGGLTPARGASAT